MCTCPNIITHVRLLHHVLAIKCHNTTLGSDQTSTAKLDQSPTSYNSSAFNLCPGPLALVENRSCVIVALKSIEPSLTELNFDDFAY